MLRVLCTLLVYYTHSYPQRMYTANWWKPPFINPVYAPVGDHKVDTNNAHHVHTPPSSALESSRDQHNHHVATCHIHHIVYIYHEFTILRLSTHAPQFIRVIILPSTSFFSVYRLVSLTSIVIKVMERIIHCQIAKALESHNRISNYQHVFGARCSCTL